MPLRHLLLIAPKNSPFCISAGALCCARANGENPKERARHWRSVPESQSRQPPWEKFSTTQTSEGSVHLIHQTDSKLSEDGLASNLLEWEVVCHPSMEVSK